MKKILFYLCLTSLIIPFHSSKAILADAKKPFVIEADQARYSDVIQTSVFTGNVILTQGTMQIRADEIETIVDPEGYQYATAKSKANKKVYLKQQREGTQEWIFAEGKQLIYDGKQNLIVLSQQAQIKRTNAKGQLLDEIKGDELVYNQLTEVFESKATPNGRTRITVTVPNQP